LKKKSLLQFGEKEIAKEGGLVGGGTQISLEPQQPVIVWGQALNPKTRAGEMPEGRRKKNKAQTLNYDLS
jgi:hypothetical protein